MKQRLLHTARDGSLYSDKVTLLYQDTENSTLIFECDPDAMYFLIRDAMLRLARSSESEASNATDETASLRRRISKLAKSTLRGGLLVFGKDLLTLLYGTSEHENVPKDKKVDALDWYMDQFCKIGVSYLLKQDVFLTGRKVEEDGKNILYEIAGIATRPVTETATTEHATVTA